MKSNSKSLISPGGFSVFEAILASFLLGVFIQVGMSASSILSRNVSKNRIMGRMNNEHDTIRSLLAGVQAKDVKNMLCGGHPYQKFDGSSSCTIDQLNNLVPGFSNPPSDPTAVNEAIRDLAEAVFNWPSINPVLDQTYFENEIGPRMVTAQCTLCHNGVQNITSRKNFRSYADIATNRPLASRNILGSSLGKKLIQKNMTFSNLLPRSSGMQHHITILTSATPGGTVSSEDTITKTDKDVTYPNCNYNQCPRLAVTNSCTTTPTCINKPQPKQKTPKPKKECKYTHTYQCIVSSSTTTGPVIPPVIEYNIHTLGMDPLTQSQKILVSGGVFE